MSTAEKDYIVDALKLRSEIPKSELKQIFEDERIVKIFHGSDTDVQLLACDLDIVTVNVFDTARAYQFLQRLPDFLKTFNTTQSSTNTASYNFISLERLISLFLEIDLDKFFQVADWRIRPLPKGMIDYARCDSHYLIAVFAIIQAMLAQSVGNGAPSDPSSATAPAGKDEEVKEEKYHAPVYYNSEDSPFQAFKEISFANQVP